MKQVGITNIKPHLLFSWPYNSISLKCMLKLLYNLEMSIRICIVLYFYDITKIALAL